MGKKRLDKIKDSEFWKNHKEKKELKLIKKENQAVYQLTLKFMKEDKLTWDQIQECYK